MNTAQNTIENYINGNLTDAKRLAKRVPFARLCDALINEYGKDHKVALAIASFLKGQGSFQDACDADYAAKQEAKL